MALTVGDRPVRPLTQDEVLLMVEAGILGDDEPVELLHGVLTAVSAKTPGHEAVKLRLVRWLAAGAAAGRFDVRIEGAGFGARPHVPARARRCGRPTG